MLYHYQTHPLIGEWFRAANGESFEVVDVDEDHNAIEIQHFDGTLEELDSEAWQAMYVEPASPPEDFSGSLDMPDEDLGSWDGAKYHASPLDVMDRS